MPSHHESRRLAYTPDQLFDLVADIGRYPQFLPWVVATRIRERQPTTITADMVVGFKMLRESFTSRVTLDRPGHIHVDYITGPLKFLRNDWRFRPADGGGTMIDFAVEFEFRNRVFERLAGAVFHEAFRRMVAAFERRAAQLYAAQAPGSGISSSSAQITA